MVLNTQAEHGKKPNQKMKPYLVLQYLLRNTDENHLVGAEDIRGFLEDCGISAERRSIYRDIDEINKILWLIEQHADDDTITIEDAEEAIDADEYGNEKVIVYDRSRKGFYVQQQKYDLTDIRLLAECVYSAKFISKAQADRLADVIGGLVSIHQEKLVRHNALLTDRVKTNNKQVLNNIATINDAMAKELDGQPHKPQKISFKYLHYTIDDLQKQVERRHGDRYVVSPYQLLINDSNYYLLAYDDQKQKIITYRVDRMKDVRFVDEPRDGEEAFHAIDLSSYTQRVFSMYSGEQRLVSIRFLNHLLDAVIDRFGTKGVLYSKDDDKHFTVSTKVEISNQFYGWLLGFGNKAKLIEPPEAVEDFKTYLSKIKEIYESEC